MVALPEHVKAALASERRPRRDTARDLLRRPGELLVFYSILPGQRVAELNTGWGYFAGVLAEAVGPTGHVYAHLTPASLKRWNGNPIEKRIERTGATNLEPVIGSMDAPNLPSGLDAVFQVMTYHDAVWSGADRAAMNEAVFAALKPGGIYGVIDHSARVGRGTEDCHAIHRIEKAVVIAEVTAAGFLLDGESDLLATPGDARTEDVHGKDIRDRTDRFVLRFRRPLGS